MPNIQQLNDANKEIKRLKNLLRLERGVASRHDADLKRAEDVNNSISKLADARINKLSQERDELRGNFAAVKYLIDGAYCENSGNNTGMEREWLNKLYRMIDTDDDNQFLTDVKVDAGKAGFYEGFSRSGEGFNDEYGCEPIELKTMANLYASELREGKS